MPLHIALRHGVSAVVDWNEAATDMDIPGARRMQVTQLKVGRFYEVSSWLVQELILFCAVVARFRPPNKAELACGGDSIVDFETEDTCSINVGRAPVLFSYSQFGC